jgi:hypothetical protein
MTRSVHGGPTAGTIKPLMVGISLFGCILGTTYAAVASEPLLTQIQFKQISDTEEKVVFQLNGFYPPELFGLQGENPRIVCDFLNTRLGKVSNPVITTNGKLIKNIRVGVHASSAPKIRVVLDLNPDRDYDIQQQFFRKESIFIITVSHKGHPSP